MEQLTDIINHENFIFIALFVLLPLCAAVIGIIKRILNIVDTKINGDKAKRTSEDDDGWFLW